MLHPTEDRVLLKAIPPDTKTKSGLIIPVEGQKIKMWEVVAVGPSEQKVKIEPGMIVVIPSEAGYDFEEDGQELRVIRHGSIDLYDYKMTHTQLLEKFCKDNKAEFKTEGLSIMVQINGMTHRFNGSSDSHREEWAKDLLSSFK